MEKNQKRLLAGLLIILLTFSAVAFAVPFYKNGIFWISYLFGIVSIMVQIYVLKTAFGKSGAKSKFYGFPIARIGIFYMGIQLIFSFIFMACANIAPIWLAFIVFVLLLAASMIGFISTDAIKDEIEKQDEKLQTDTQCILLLRSQMRLLTEQCENPEGKKALKTLSEEFQYSDPVSNETLKKLEQELTTLVNQLQKSVINRNIEEIISLCKKTTDVLMERNQICKLNKKK